MRLALHSSLALVAALLAPAVVRAHPHGEIQCGAEVRLHEGKLALLQGTLLLDEAHSREALALLRQPGSETLDPALLHRFAFGLKLQFGRANWLFDLQADGQPLALQAGEPEISVQQGRLRVSVSLDATQQVEPARHWSLRCADPSYYWVTAFASHSELQPVTAATWASGVQVLGCARTMAMPVEAVAAPAGMARQDWRCD